jgi:hypothetical protein
MHCVEIMMKKSINNKLFLADGEGDGQTDRNDEANNLELV